MSSKALLRFAIAAVFTLLLSLPVLAESHVRIVRLSYIDGGVTIDRNTGQFEKAIVNLPITEGTKLRTADGRAEVEFEDGSTMRLASNTNVQFTKLSLLDSGGKLSMADVQNGTVYVDFTAAKHDELTLLFGSSKTTLTQNAHLRIDANDLGTALAVFKGDVQVEGPSGSVQVKKNQTASFAAGENAKAVVAKNIEPEPLDSWDKKQSEYHQVYASNSYTNYSPYTYGTSDLAYYGNFFSAPGYGMMWQPYFIGAGWNPFMDGAWAFSPGFGYGWVSAYPWGWVPYHYGTWVFLPGYGWAWQPGGMWTPYYS
ncbi:MAG TPA: FecR family protein, partial [Terriglobales bacterium]|nr:FecR family protein [Terriglobales bacterium]